MTDIQSGWAPTPYKKKASKCKRPFKIMSRCTLGPFRREGWRVWKRYETEQQAEMALAHLSRSHHDFWEFRIQRPVEGTQ